MQKSKQVKGTEPSPRGGCYLGVVGGQDKEYEMWKVEWERLFSDRETEKTEAGQQKAAWHVQTEAEQAQSRDGCSEVGTSARTTARTSFLSSLESAGSSPAQLQCWQTAGWRTEGL